MFLQWSLLLGFHSPRPFLAPSPIPTFKKASPLSPLAALPSRTQRIMERISTSGEVGGAGGAYSYDALKRMDRLLSEICSNPSKNNAQVVFRVSGPSNDYDPKNKASFTFDVIVCGGTLGIFIATALLSKGLRVGIVEKNQIKGREQDWNISRKELMELVDVGILSEDEIEQIMTVKFNPNRCGFEKKGDIWVEDILNLGVSPVKLLEFMKKRFVTQGGVLFEGIGLSTINVHDDIVILQLSDGDLLFSRLLVDAMGNFSPVVKQIRSGRKPDGICLVVGSCSRGFKENSSSDIIYSNSSVKRVGDSNVQYFWEAFPAGSGLTDRTTYMFTYVDAQPSCPKLEDLLEDYWDLMPDYQGVPLDQLEVGRVIFGIFPTYRDSPLPSAFDRVIQVGDASGIQSPVSFGGFGSMTRHLNRLSNGIFEAVSGNFLDAYSLSLLNPYLPNLSASWLFQRAMSAKLNVAVSSTFINDLLYANFLAMQKLGDPVLRPFLQDVIQFWPLAKTLGLVMLSQPWLLPSIFKQVGIAVILDWSGHFVMLGWYTFLSSYLDPIIRPWIKLLPLKQKYEWNRNLEAWKYGAGLDYNISHNPEN
ncbi:putative lycopene beta-cyclase [Dioscorea sansibarensis]